MPTRISGIVLPDQKRVVIALTSIFGIGKSLSKKILDDLEIDPSMKAKDLAASEENKLRDYIEKNIKVEGELKREIMTHIKHLKDVNSYRGTRHTKRLPVRGQRTKTNTRTVRGNVRRTAGSGRKTAAQKT